MADGHELVEGVEGVSSVEPTGAAATGAAVRRSQQAGSLGLGQDGGELGGSVPKLETGITGFDDLTMGGLPIRRATVLAGQAGSAKTVFAGQFLAEGIRRGQPGVFVTLEEPATDLRANFTTLGMDVAGWEAAGDWRFVDASPAVREGEDGAPVLAAFSTDTLLAQIGHAVDATGADRLVLDSLNGMLSLQTDPTLARQLLRRLIARLRAMGLTVVLTVETPGEPGGALSSYGVEEFVADNVVLLHHVRDGFLRRRAVEVLKMRGAMHHKGEVAFTVLPGRGVVVLPLARRPVAERSAPVRVTAGDDELDGMLDGGLLSPSSVLLSGPTGTGKSTLATQLLAAGGHAGERGLLLAFEESHDQVLRNAASTGADLAALERSGLLNVQATYPDVASLDDHLVQIQELVERYRPARVVVDSLSALERLGSLDSYRQFVTRLSSFLREQDAVAVFTAASASLMGGSSVSDSHVSALVDAVLLLRYVEERGQVRRALTVLKQRGSSHDMRIREFTITRAGFVVGEPMTGLGGILTGTRHA